MKILFVGQNLQMGGVQKALINTLKIIAKDKNYEIELFLFGDGELIKEIPTNINVIYGKRLLRLVATPFKNVLNSKNIIDIILRILLMICVRLIGSEKLYYYLFKNYDFKEKYDIAISYFNDVPNNYFNQGTNKFVKENISSIKSIAWIHTDPIEANFSKEDCIKLYSYFNNLVCVSNGCKENLSNLIPELKKKLEVVYNPIPLNEINSKSKEFVANYEKSKINFITVARIDNKSKRIDRIIDVIDKLVNNNIKNFKWTVVGDGQDLKKNIEYANYKKLNKYISFEGEKENPYPYIKDADFFILTSAYEGYPLVISEALLLKTPVVTTKYAAVNEQIINEKNGLISENSTEDLYNKLKNLLTNDDVRKKLKKYVSGMDLDNKKVLNQLKNILEI